MTSVPTRAARSQMMKIVLALALVASASAFVAPQASTVSRTATVTEANAKVVFICS